MPLYMARKHPIRQGIGTEWADGDPLKLANSETHLVRVDREVVETASDLLRSATDEQPVVCQGTEEFSGLHHRNAGQISDLGRRDPTS